MLYMGIDGGGTKTKFTLINENEEIIASIEKGTCHYNQVGFDGLEKVLREGLEEIINIAKNKEDEIIRGCIGLAGYGKIKSVANNIEEIVKKVFKNIEFTLHNDVMIAHAGALSGEDGIVIIAGTGSIGYSLNKGITNRSGGWGYTIGDEGSAYWIGRKAIECFSKESDGRLVKGSLYTLLKNNLNIQDDYDLITYINEIIKSDRGNMAKIATICCQAANDGDINAKEIFNQAGIELAELINSLLKEFTDDKVVASYIGGVFKAEELILKPIGDNIDNRVILRAPKYPPDIGACLIAKRLHY